MHGYKLENYNEKIIPQYELMSNIRIKNYLEIKHDSKVKINAIELTGKKEILIAMSNGSVAVYSHETDNPECKIKFNFQLSLIYMVRKSQGYFGMKRKKCYYQHRWISLLN